MEFRGRVNDWIAEVRQARERGDAVLFVADSQGRAERTIEILQEYDIVAVPVERAEDAHAASVLVAVGSLSRGFRLDRRGACRSTPRPTSSRKNVTRPRSGATSRRRSSPICAI